MTEVRDIQRSMEIHKGSEKNGLGQDRESEVQKGGRMMGVLSIVITEQE